ncbi:Ba144/Ba145 [Baboon cytomegalovirus]|nr:Ba144/Ba145 [Baboon cytomegalovirus]
MDNNMLTRKYWTFYNVTRALHQSVNTDFDVQQHCFESARLVKCVDGEGTTTSFGKGWLCITVIQSGGTSGEKPQQRPGCLSLDVTIENTVETLSGRGMVLKNKNVSSVVGNSGPHDSSLLTVLIEGNNIQVTQVKHCVRSVDAGSQASSSGASSSSIAAAASSASSEEKRARSEHRREHKKQQQQQQMLQQQHQQANSMVDGSSGGGGSNGQVRVSGGPDGRDPRMLNRPKERRPDADDKRQKTHHDHSKNDSEHPPRLAPESDPVAFLNFSHAPSLMDAGGDGAFLNDTSGFGDAAGEPDEAQSAAPALGNSGAEVGPIIDDGVRASTSTAAHLSPSESSSNCPVPPNPQASSTTTITDPISPPLPPPPRSPPFEDIIQSLTRLINECSKDVPNIPPLPTRRVSECESRAATPVASTSTTNAGASTSNANVAPDVPRPVCEIRPYMVTPAAPPPQQQPPEQAAIARRTRGGARPRNGSRGGGGGRRSSASSSSSSRRRRRNRDDDESEDEILPGPSRRRAVPPSLVEDGLEIIDAEEEVALAAASIASFFD